MPEEGEEEREVDEQEKGEGQVAAEGGGDIDADQGHAEARIEIEAADHFPADDGHRQHGDLRLRVGAGGEEHDEHITEGEVQGDEDDDPRQAIRFDALPVSVAVAEGQDDGGDKSDNPEAGRLGKGEQADNLTGKSEDAERDGAFGVAADARGEQGAGFVEQGWKEGEEE